MTRRHPWNGCSNTFPPPFLQWLWLCCTITSLVLKAAAAAAAAAEPSLTTTMTTTPSQRLAFVNYHRHRTTRSGGVDCPTKSLRGPLSTSITDTNNVDAVPTVNNELLSGLEGLKLPPLPDPAADPADDVFRSMRDTWPLERINFLRDSGLGRLIADTLFVLGLPVFAREYPDAIETFFSLTTRCRTERYGPHSSQFLDFIEPDAPNGPLQSSSSSSSSPETTANQDDKDDVQKGNNDIVVVCHGGAWGSGQPWMYRIMADCFVQRNHTVAVWGYRTYPDGNVADQSQDLIDAIAFIRQKYPGRNITVIGHSSGSHVGMLAAIQVAQSQNTTQPLCERFISLGAVYDVPNHVQWERARGLDELSPLNPAAGGTNDAWIAASPTRIVEQHTVMNGGALTPMPPSMLLVHGGRDTVVPYTSSLNLTKALYSNNPAYRGCRFELLPTTGHADTVIDIMFGGPTQEAVLRWMDGDTERTPYELD